MPKEKSKMKFDAVLIKLTILLLAQQFIAIFKNTITRWIIKNVLTSGELPIGQWYSVDFIKALNVSRVAGLAVIASFTLVSFPLGMWIASFKMDQSYPITRIISAAMSFITFPINFYLMSKTLKEMPINRTTLTGAFLVLFAQAIMVLAGWNLYQGGKTID